MKLSFVIMDCYDEFTFDRCVQSITLQTETDYEILVVGQRDVTQIISEGITLPYYTCLDDVSDMLETALDYATGDFVCFIDSVHCYSPFFAEKMSALCTAGTDMACCGYVGIQRNTLLSQVGVPLMMYHPENLSPAEYLEKCTTGDTVSVEMNNYFENKLYRRTMLQACRPLATDETMDIGIVQHLLKTCGNVALTQEPLLFVCIE